jgi:hypothetical protein
VVKGIIIIIIIIIENGLSRRQNRDLDLPNKEKFPKKWTKIGLPLLVYM